MNAPAVLAGLKVKENERRLRYLYLAREFNTFWNMTLKVILIIIGVQGLIPFEPRKEKRMR